MLSLRDITSRLKIERMARQSEHRRQRAEKLETTSRLAGGIAQRLESLLTSVLGDTSLALTAAEDDSENWNLLQRIEIAAQRATELVASAFHVFHVSRPNREPIAADRS